MVQKIIRGILYTLLIVPIFYGMALDAAITMPLMGGVALAVALIKVWMTKKSAHKKGYLMLAGALVIYAVFTVMTGQRQFQHIQERATPVVKAVENYNNENGRYPQHGNDIYTQSSTLPRTVRCVMPLLAKQEALVRYSKVKDQEQYEVILRCGYMLYRYSSETRQWYEQSI